MENSNGTVHPGGNFPEKINTFRGITFQSRSYRDDRDFLYHLFGLLVPGFMSGESEKFTGILWMVQINPVPVLGIKKNTSTIWRKIFSEISVQMVSAQSGCVGRLGTEGKKEIFARLRVVLYFLSKIAERAKCERASKSPITRKAPFSRGVIFTRACVSLAPLSLRESEGSTCSLDYCYFY